MSNYTKQQVRKNIFVSSIISLDDIIGFESMESMWEDMINWNLGCQFWEYDIEQDDVNELKKIVSKKMSLSKQEREDFDFEWATRKVMSDTYTNKYESELYDELFNHIENELSCINSYHFETSKGTDSVHFGECSHIRVGMTKKEFEIAFENDLQYYDTKEEFFENAQNTFDEYISELYSKYDLEHFDYYGSRVCIYNEWQQNIFDSIDYEMSEVETKRKKHQNQIKQWIKNKVNLSYRDNNAILCSC